jgi:hypothetical protein
MNPLSRFLAAIASILGLVGCGSSPMEQLKPGISTAQEIRSRLGAPGMEWPNADGGATWEYSGQPEGSQCWMLTLDARGVLQNLEQTLTDKHLARIEAGWTETQVRRLLGKPRSEVKSERKPEVVWEWKVEAAFRRRARFLSRLFRPGRQGDTYRPARGRPAH